MNSEKITIEHGGGGYKSSELIDEIRSILPVGKSSDKRLTWANCHDDGAILNLGALLLSDFRSKAPKYDANLVFTTDAFIVDPIFFPGGDIGKIAMCGTINDLSVMGAKPLGISVSVVIEEGFPKKDFFEIMKSIAKVSKESGVPVVTGDTKVIEKGKIDKIEITTAGVGLTENVIHNDGIRAGDFIIVSGDLGEHTVALLSSRFNYKTKIKSDSKSLNKELEKVGKYLNACKDPTRGGLSANLVEMAEKAKVKVILEEQDLPYKKETVALSELLGIDVFAFASEGRFVASVSPKNADKVLKILQEFNKEAKVIGKAEKPAPRSSKSEVGGVWLKTNLGSLRPIESPRGKLIPRIC
jgi:hydrogenase expression/formation protein HypE